MKGGAVRYTVFLLFVALLISGCAGHTVKTRMSFRISAGPIIS